MARPRPEKKSNPTASAERRALPMELQIGDWLAEETGEWEVVYHPYTSKEGKDVHVRVKKVGQPDVTEIRSWGAHKRIAVKR